MCIVSKNGYTELTEMKRPAISNECAIQQFWYYIMPQDTLNATDFATKVAMVYQYKSHCLGHFL